MKKQKKKKFKAQNSAANTTNNSTKKIFYSAIYSVSIFILLFIISITAAIVLEINMNYTDIFHSLWMYDIEANIYIICILDKYIKDRDAGFGDYVAVDEKSVKVDLYRTSIIAVNILNGPDIIIFADTVYCFIFLINIVSTKYFQFKEVYLNEKYNQLYKKKSYNIF